MLLSVIIPVFNEEEIVAKTYEVLEEELKNVEHELIFVNDGSKDRTREIVEGLLPSNPNNKIVNFSRNFGHQAAFSAGLDKASGDAVVIIDGDLQDPPSLIHEMLEKWREGYQVVYAQRNKRAGETIFKKFTAFAFYRLIGKLTSIEIPPDTGDFRLMDRCVVDQLKNLPERSRFLRGLVCWVGFKKIGVKYDRAERTAGTSKYPLKKMLRLAFDGITGFSSAPLKLSFYAGMFATIVGLGLFVWSIIEKIFYPTTTVPGWASLMTAIVFFGGVQLISIGIMGEYIGRIYDEVKQRPLYIEDKK
ncbi:dolichol-phosphate mannosyltransferase [Fibrobacter sp. UWH9]|uniref:glycosyltransferase family 2 protein n=1 Tax=unclassified Fibrobacter TaxID=2634177 RepID=UPI0009219CE8|nr:MULTISPECIES: glycosyltransferase family 2 protein [Fibrobacter]MCL4101400.1 putative glycosyltransferase [Fibrobacter succinogenes]OWV07594.1 glycosyltransferase [Fibrobacter sp. UWH3]OWV17481.1 glycosyltransferase [Fibrobacter sp. UWH1]SHH02624.1 dolichol-phosphate mannosyltransferase [Fibrobacter sp. UWH9]SHK58929.1 dolichol-phosphate mannosyltransferase [Fibrobacter sp. UWH6]